MKKVIGYFMAEWTYLLWNIKSTAKWLWNACGNWKTLVWFFVYYLAFSSPTICGYLLYFITKNAWHLTYANACIAFWAGPGTPELPLCVGMAIGTRKLLNKIKHRKRYDYNKISWR